MIVGLGNPGPEYAGTRHNIGFDVVEALAGAHKIKLTHRKHRAVYGEGVANGVSIVLARPMTYMNLSGQAVSALVQSYGLMPERIVVVADDLDLPLGRLRVRSEGGSGGHNGHKSIIHSLGTQGYPRIRIGIGKEGETVDHVLNKFHPDERQVVAEVVTKSVRAIERIIEAGVERAMGDFNGA